MKQYHQVEHPGCYVDSNSSKKTVHSIFDATEMLCRGFLRMYMLRYMWRAKYRALYGFNMKKIRIKLYNIRYIFFNCKYYFINIVSNVNPDSPLRVIYFRRQHGLILRILNGLRFLTIPCCG